MTDDLKEMQGRQDRLEGRVTVLEATVKEEAGLRAKMDSDLGEMKATLIAHKHSLQALHDTQSDHTTRLTRIEDKATRIEGKVGGIENKVETIKNKVETIENKVETIENKVETIQNKVGTIQNKVGTIENKVGTIENKVGSIEGRVGSIEQGLGDVHIGVHAIHGLLDTHLVRRPRRVSLAGLLRRNRPRGGS